VRAQVKVAADHDREMQALLEQAIVRLEDAQADLVQGTQDVQTERSALAAYAVSSFQTGGTAVLNLGVAFNAETPQQALDGMQASATVLDKQVVALQQYEATKVLLELTEKRVQATKDDVQQKREDAASVLEVKRALQAQARVARANMLDRLGTLQDAKRQIADAKARERRHLQTMQRERNRVEERLRKIAERRARQHQRVAVATTHEGGGYLSYPVMHTYITSPYGMRMHPILHVWKLHDGTDFHAPCGTAVYAAAPGRVISEYYNVGYGNRLIVDHGFVHGVSLQTSYNHLTSWVAHPGQRVRRGQLIAYSGTTGYSTACHLHFMVYVNGYTVNPVTWL
jgi:murein DD-endopeptidase MepM/ murein hydrolase activator NlpD